MDGRKPTLLEMLATLVSVGVMAYMTISPQERYWIRLQALGLLHRASARLAWRAGHKGMSDELSGRDCQRYGLAYRLSQLRDLAARALEDMRP